MPRPSTMAKVVFQGATSGGEIFETGFWMHQPTSTEAELKSLADDIRDLANTRLLTSDVLSMIATDTSWVEVRVYGYAAGSGPAYAVATSSFTSKTGTSSAKACLQQSMCITLLTGSAGRRARGRMYMPASGIALTDGHLFTAGFAQAAVDALADFFDGVNALSDGDNRVQVLSTVGSTALPITSCRTDQRPDIQRRRANQQPVGSFKSNDLAP